MRKEFIGFKVTEQENVRIRREAETSKVNLSTYVRTSSLEKDIKVIDGLREMIPELNAIGNNLNQLTVMHIHNPNLEAIKEQFTQFVELAESTLEGR